MLSRGFSWEIRGCGLEKVMEVDGKDFEGMVEGVGNGKSMANLARDFEST
jgi:hypothetical protein